MIACEQCDVLNVPGSTTCVECGADLVPPLPTGKAPPPMPATAGGGKRKKFVSRRERDPEQVERSRQRQEFARIKNTVFTIRSVYWSGVVFALVQLLIYHLILQGPLDGLDLSGTSLLWMVGSWLQFALMTAGSLLVVRQPFLWSILGASWWTVSTGYVAYIYVELLEVLENAPRRIRDDPMWDSISTRAIVYLAIMAIVVVAFWFAAAQARRIEELMRLNPDFELKRKRRAGDHTPEEGIADNARARRQQEFQRNNAAALRVILMAGGALLVLGGGAWWLLRPPGVDDHIEQFERHWRAGDVQALSGLMDPTRANLASMVRLAFERRGWSDEPPALTDPQIDIGDERADVAWQCDGDLLVVRWRLEQKKWYAWSVDLPDLAAPDQQTAIREFRQAWDQPGTAAILAMVKPGSDRVARGIERLLTDRDLADRREPLGESDPGRVRGARFRTLFGYGTSDVEVRFEYWHPRWRIVGFRPPAK